MSDTEFDGRYALPLQSFREAMLLFDHRVIDYNEFGQLINECRKMLDLKSIEVDNANFCFFRNGIEQIDAMRNRIFVLERQLGDLQDKLKESEAKP